MVPPHPRPQKIRPSVDGTAIRRCRPPHGPTHAAKAGVRYRYYASASVLHGEAKSVSIGSISRVPAADVEEAVVKSLKDIWPNSKMAGRPAVFPSTITQPSNSWLPRSLCTRTSSSFASNRKPTTKEPTCPTIDRSRFPGRNRRPNGVARFCFPRINRETTSGHNTPSAVHAWSAPLREAVIGSMISSQVG